MGKHICEQAAQFTAVQAYLPGEGDNDHGDPLLVLDDGSIEFRIVGPLSTIKEKLMTAVMVVDAAQQRDYANTTGFNIGDEVKVGGGSTYWKITGFGTLATPEDTPIIVAHLRQMGGYNNTTVLVDRLRVP